MNNMSQYPDLKLRANNSALAAIQFTELPTFFINLPGNSMKLFRFDDITM